MPLRTIGAIDIGTNSIRLAVARLEPGVGFTVVAQQKEVVRLGEGEFVHNRITGPAMERGLVVLRRFVEMARGLGAEDVFAVATAAVREAGNRDEFVERASIECGIDVRVVSGVEEARLIYLGIVSGVDLGFQRALFVDIGGGTTELIIGDAKQYEMLESLKLGAVRVSERFHAGGSGPVDRKKYAKMREYVRGVANYATKKLKDQGFDLAYGSSGTIINLAEITARRIDPGVTTIRNYPLRYSDLQETVSVLSGLGLEARRNVPGINPERADIIVAGAAILDEIMSSFGADIIRISDRALRDGIMIDHQLQEDNALQEYHTTSPRERSILRLGRACTFEETHSFKVADLAKSLFKDTAEMGLHSYGPAEMELLEYAALAHDVGIFVSMSNHHRHSYYLIRNWQLLGFDDDEIEIIAAAALCHRRLSPKKVSLALLNANQRKLVGFLAAIVRVADALDRSQLGLVSDVVLRWKKPQSKLIIEVHAGQECPLEMWAFEVKKRLFESTFGVTLTAELKITALGVA